MWVYTHKLHLIATFAIKVGGLEGISYQVDVVVATACEVLLESLEQLAPIATATDVRSNP